MRVLPSILMSILASAVASFLLRRIFAASSAGGAPSPGNANVNVVVIMPIMIGNTRVFPRRGLKRRALRTLRALASR